MKVNWQEDSLKVGLLLYFGLKKKKNQEFKNAY